MLTKKNVVFHVWNDFESLSFNPHMPRAVGLGSEQWCDVSPLCDFPKPFTGLAVAPTSRHTHLS